MFEEENKYSEAWNFGPELDSIVPVWEIGELIIKNYGRRELEDKSNKDEVHEAKLLALDISKARFKLGWKPTWNIEKAIEKTVEWYREYNSKNVYELCVKQIEEFIKNNKN